MSQRIKRPKMRFGELAVQAGLVTKDQLADALVVQEATPGKNLGEVLVGMGICTDAAVEMVAAWQERLRNGGVDVQQACADACSENTADTNLAELRAMAEAKKEPAG